MNITNYFRGIMKISNVKLEDVNALVSLEYDLFRDNAKDRLFFEKTTRGGNTHCIITKSGKEIVGYLVYFSKDGTVELLTLGVAAGYQRQGIATGMLNVLIDLDKYKEIYCVISEYNLAAQMLLKSVGMNYWKTSKSLYAENVDGYFFRKVTQVN